MSPCILQTFYKEPKPSCPKMTSDTEGVLDFALPIEGTVKYSYHNCDFRPFVIRNRMSLHQDTTEHPRRQRFGERAAERSWSTKSKGENHQSTVATSCTRICSVLPRMHRKRESSQGPFKKKTAKKFQAVTFWNKRVLRQFQ